MIDLVSALLANVTAARAATLDAALSSRLGSIKNIQYGTISIPGSPGNNSATATITTVVAAKSIVLLLGYTSDANVANSDRLTRLSFNGTSAVIAQRTITSYNPAIVLGFCVVEWN